MRPHGADQLRILVADDNDDGRNMLNFLLSGEGYTLATAWEGPPALAAIARFRPDVAILDIGMPGMNGYRVAEALRLNGRTRPQLLIARSGRRQSPGLASRVRSSLHQPVEISALSALLATISPKASAPTGN